MSNRANTFAFLLFCAIFPEQVRAKEGIQAYFSNDSINGLKFSDAYETHNMGFIYFKEPYYLKLDLGIVSPDMHKTHHHREPNRSFGELISLEIGQSENSNDDLRFYARVKATGDFGIDKIQDLAHRVLSLQQVNEVNELIRMPADAWVGVGLRSEFQLSCGSPETNLILMAFWGQTLLS